MLGLAVLWAVPAGAALKFALNEGLARQQLASGRSFLEVLHERLPAPLLWLLFAYFVLWSFFVGAALMAACAAVAAAALPALSGDGARLALGAGHGLVGALLVAAGGFALFERAMRACILVMFVVVVATAARLLPQALAAAPPATDAGDALGWTLALIGGVGGTVTVLCYGYWIREAGRTADADLPHCRLDLAAGYAVTALFGTAMVVIGAALPVEGKGAGLIVRLADTLAGALGEPWRWAFLAGAWGAMASSLLGVWQAVPYLFADNVRLWRGRPAGDLDRTPAYRLALALIATVPAAGLVLSFREVQQLYAVAGALFMPALAALLLWLNNDRRLVGHRANGAAANAALALTLALFGWIALR